LAIELFNASQALSLRTYLKSSEFIERLLSFYRTEVDFVSVYRALYKDIENSIAFLDTLSIDSNEMF